MSVKIFCDKCGKDCKLFAYDLQVGVMHNPSPTHIFDTAQAKITCDNRQIHIVLCENCYKELGLPNIYKTYRSKTLTWRERDKK